MKYVRALFEARPFWQLRSDQSLISGDNPQGDGHARSALAKDGSFAVLYLPTGGELSVRLTGLSGKALRAWWFNPRQNASQLIGTFERSHDTQERRFNAPSRGRNNDWLLVIEDAAKDLPRLGSSYQNIVPKVAE